MPGASQTPKNRRLPYRSSLLVALLLLTIPRASLSDFDSDPPRGAGSRVDELELVGRWEIPEPRSNPRDVRWASDDSIFLAIEEVGVVERTLAEGLPVVRQVFPGHGETSPWVGVLNLAVSGSRLLAWDYSDHAAWIDVGESNSGQPHVKSMRGYFDDIDVRDDVVALLGYPTASLFGESGQTFLWLGDLASGLERWAPLTVLREDRGEIVSTPGVGTLGLHLGSVRFLANGDLLVVPAFKPGVYRIGRSGKQRAYWSMEELEASLLAALGVERLAVSEPPLPLEAEPSTWERGSRYIASQRLVVEDVISIRDLGAILVRHGRGEESRYYLGVLGANLEWLSVPVRANAPTDRIRADYSKSTGKLVILATHRAGPVVGASSLFLVSAP